MRLPALQHAQRLSEAAGEAAEALRGDDGALDSLGAARAALSRVAGIDSELDSLGERLAEAEALLDDVSSATRVYRDAVEHDPRALDAAMTRLSALTGLTRKYGPLLDDVLGQRDEARNRLAEMGYGSEELSRAAERVALARVELVRSAETLELLRRNGAPGFVEALAEAASDLAMEGASYDVRFSELPFDSWTADGASRIEFLFAAGPGQPPRPLTRVASGGEISRVMLALKSVLGNADTVQTLVFDEIDAGIGGSTATAVGRRLAQLALTHQVIVVTHLAQVAAFADRHVVVSKSVDGERAATTAVEVSGTDRIAEVARMLSGSDSEASCAHASELLQAAASAVTGR
jgi:DNA repair protein RecN (Recombination protein N)